MRLILALAAAFTLSGCIAKTAANIVTLPVRAVSHGVDAVTTSQSERDQAEGRRLRQEDERRGREARGAQRRSRDEGRRHRRGDEEDDNSSSDAQPR